jgi:hypothetical protein
MALETMKTVEDVIKTLEIYRTTPTGKNVIIELIEVLALEIKVLKVELIKHKLLIEHEEKIRTSFKEKRKIERNIPRKFKSGDVVCRVKDLNKSGQIITVKNDRAKVLFDETPCWVALRSLTYYQASSIVL